MRISTKAQREAIQQANKESHLKNGYQLEIFEGLQIFTKHDTNQNKWYLIAYKDNSTNAILNYFYNNFEGMNKRIEQTKNNYTDQREWKEKRKSEQKGRLTGAAACADAIRAELKQVFSGVKFSVKSDTFANGDAVRISWSDGPTTKEVDSITGKYSDGYFDSMQDMYIHTNNSDLPTAKYITTSRDMSAETSAILKPIANDLFESLKNHSNDFRPFHCYDASNFLYQLFCKASFKQGAKAVNIIKTDETCGLNEASTFYQIDFDLTEVKESIKPTQAETKQGSVNVVVYGKGLAVIGETYAIKDKLKAIGGRFNKFLTCGAGWVFTSDKLEEIKQMLLSIKESKEVAKVEEVQEVSTEETKTTLNEEINKTLDFFAQTDLKMIGQITEGTKECFNIQKPEVEEFKTLEGITEAAKGGKVISILNLFDLVQADQRKAIN